MTPEDAQQIIAKSARLMVRRTALDAVNYIRTGQSREFLNPFSGKTTSIVVPPEWVAFAAQVRRAGLHKDPEFITALRAFVKSTACGPLFSFMTALDGEGAFEENIQVDLKLRDGAILPGYLHEVFYPLEREDEQLD